MNIVNMNNEKFVLGVGTSVLFDMSQEDACYRKYGPDGYRRYMLERIDEPLRINESFFKYIKDYSERENHEVVIISRNTPLTALRAIKAMIKFGLVPSAFAFTNGNDPVRYLQAYGTDDFLSANQGDVGLALRRGLAAIYIENPLKEKIGEIRTRKAAIVPIPTAIQQNSNIVVIGNHRPAHDLKEHSVFDFDGVIVGLSSERVYQKQGLGLYREFERANLQNPLEKGPFHDLLVKVSNNKRQYLTSICTVRGYYPAYRCLYDLAKKDIDINGEFHATAGRDKEEILRILASSYRIPSFFRDDNKKYIEQAKRGGVSLAGHVAHPVDPNPAA